MRVRKRNHIVEHFCRNNMWCKVINCILVMTLIIGSVSVRDVVCYATETEQDSTVSSDDGVVDASLDKARQDAKEAEEKKNEAQAILDDLESAKNNIEAYITQLDISLNEIQLEINRLEEDQQELQKSIKKTQKELNAAKAAQDEQYVAMKQRIQMVYESGNKGYLDVLLTASSMTDMLNKTEYVAQVSFYDYTVLEQLREAKEQVANLKLKLDNDLAANEKLQVEVKEQKATLETLVEEKNAQVAQYEESIAGQQEEVEKYARAQAQAEAIIAEAERQYANNKEYTGGEFTWPAPGNYTITSYFGLRNSPTSGASSDHKGIDIACNMGDSVVAAADGVVIVSTYNYAEGNYICIDHGSGIVTVYMHNSTLLVSPGQSVTAGQQIAAAGSTGYSTGPHLHFGVRVNGTYVDPLSYLQ